MGRHQENKTRLVCGAITCAVSFCLLTCAFANVAYADYNDLPSSYTDETGGNYNPEGVLFGTDALVFTDAWYADETIFSQSLSSTFQIVQDKTAIYTAIVADCVRQSNNWLSQIRSYVDDISSSVSTISNDTGMLLTELKFNSYQNTKTIRGIVKDIADAMVTNNASLQQIKDTFYDGNGYNLIGYIKSNTDYLYTINNTLTSPANGTIRDLIGDIEGHTAGTNTYLNSILTELRSGGYIGQQLADLNSTLTTISNNLRQYTYTDANGSTVRYFWVAPLMPSDSAAQNWMSNVRNYLDNIRSYTSNLSSKIDLIRSDVSSIVNALGSGGYIGQQLADLNSTLTTISNNLRQYSYTDANGDTVRYTWVALLMPADSLAQNWMANVRNELRSISNALQTIANNLVSYTYTDSAGRSVKYFWVSALKPSDIGAQNWMNDVRNLLSQISSGQVSVDLSATNEKLNQILLAIQGLDLVFNLPTNLPDIIGDFDDLDFGEKVDDLIDELQNLAPFGAIFLISNQINLLTQVEALTDPSFIMDFNFAGTNENITLDVSWLNDAKPLFNFITIFLLIYSLLIVSMKYVRQEATS